MSEPRTRSTFGGLTKNESIPVTIDDLNEGLIVVSYSHNDNLFQGVLLQLNRERGIPVGISFPKDFCTGEGLKESEKDPSQVPPLVQRQTYFQDHGAASRSLRRVIKPPARFKNSRMALRPVQRPILCAKCGSRCEDKETPQVTTTTSNVTEDSTDKTTTVKHTNKKRKLKGESTGVPVALKPHIPATPILPVIDDPKDFNYESVGNRGILHNVWNRPLAKPLKYQNRNNGARISPEQYLNKVTSSNGERKAPLKTVPNTSIASTITSSSSPSQNKISSLTLSNNNNSGNSLTDQQNNLTICNLLKTKPLAPPPVFRITRSILDNKSSVKTTPENKKVHNLKLCLSKLTTAKTFEEEYNGKESLHFISGESVPSSSDTGVSGISNNPISKELLWESEIKSYTKSSKGRVRKRNATVPLRFQDQSTATKDIVGGTNMTNELSKSFPPLPKVKVSLTKKASSDEFPGQTEYQINEYLVDSQPVIDHCNHLPKPTVPPFRASIVNPFEDTLQSNKTVTKPIEPTKTPVIKITFGSSGNGMVVQIPPKTTQQLDNSNALESKAARRAMKKAKKEARKKHSTELSTENALSSSLSPEMHRELANPVCDGNESDRNQTSSFEDNNLEEVVATSKKRKKEKKKKREKDHKENDLLITASDSTAQVYVLDTAIRKEPSSPAPRTDEEPISSNTVDSSPLLLQVFEPSPAGVTENTSI